MNTENKKQQNKPTKKYFTQWKDYIVLVIAVGSGLYLLNFSVGMAEFLPDILPIVGNIDEAVATVAFISAMSYFGLDLTRFFSRKG